MYCYCGNNPIMYKDSSGHYPVRVNQTENVFGWIFSYRNKDGSWSLYDNDRFEDKTPFHEQWLVFNFSKPSFDLKEGKIGLGSISFDLITGGWEWEHFDLSLLDFGHAEVSAEFFDGNLSVGAFASIWSPSVSFDIFGVRIELSVEVGAIGADLDVGAGGFSAKGAYLWGLGLSIDW